MTSPPVVRVVRKWGVLSALTLAALAGAAGSAQAGRCPSLTIVLERSGSMLWDLAGHYDVPDPDKQRWGIAKAAIGRAVAAYMDKLPLGLTFFPSDDQCASESTLRIPPAYGKQAAIQTALADGSLSPDGGGIPTCGAIGKAAQALAEDSRDSYLLLVTDGLPTCDGTCNIDPRDPASSAVKVISAAGRSTHPVKTIVLGIGNLDPLTRDGLTRMAAAGGFPDRTNPVLKFFSANDVAALDAALERIMHQLVVGDSGVACDDSCTKTGCTGSGEICVRGTCLRDPCLSVACGTGEYCLSTGSSAKCVSGCDKTCAPGNRCHLGRCIHDPCNQPCGPGNKCQESPGSASGECVPDPACTGVSCADGLGCIAGFCHDDPCQYTTCPPGLSCVPFDGSCLAQTFLNPDPGTDDVLISGCSIGVRASRASAPWAALLSAALGLLLLSLSASGRRRRSAARGAPATRI